MDRDDTSFQDNRSGDPETEQTGHLEVVSVQTLLWEAPGVLVIRSFFQLQQPVQRRQAGGARGGPSLPQHELHRGRGERGAGLE